MKRPILFFLFAIIITIISAAYNILYALLPVLIGCYYLLKKQKVTGIVFICLFLICTTLMQSLLILNHKTRLDIFDKTDITITAQAVQYPEYTDGRSRAVFKILSVNEMPEYKGGDKILLSIYSEEFTEIVPGGIYKITGRIKVPEHETNPGGFDYNFYLKTRNLHLTMWTMPETFSYMGQDSLPFFYDKLLLIRTYCINTVSSSLPSREASVLSSVIFGSNAIDNDIITDFRNIGITHILAVSGLNTGILYIFIGSILKLLKAGRKTRFGIMTFSILFYLLLTGMCVSMLRASIMMWFICLSEFLGKKGDNFNFLCIAALLILLFNPLSLFGVSFQMSFTAVLVIVLFMPVIDYKLKNIKKKYLRKTISFILMCIIIQIAMAPITIYYFNSFSLISVIANIFIIPVTSIILPAALTGVIFSFIPYVGTGLLWFADLFIKYILWAADIFSAVPYAYFYVRSTKWYEFTLLYTVLLAAFGYLDIQIKKYKIMVFSAAAIFVTFTVLAYFPPLHSRVYFIDVGFGDCALIRTNKGQTVLIDGGGYLSSNTADYDILPLLHYYNIRHIDAVVATHSDSDHIGGIIGVLGKIKIGAVYADDDGGELYKIMKEKADKIHIPVIAVFKNDIINADGLKLHVLNPQNMSASENDSSIVLECEIDGYHFLFTADAGKKPLDAIRKTVDLSDINVIKAYHHGSFFNTLDDLYAESSAEFSIISVGANGYNLPSEKFTAMLDKMKIPYYRTDDCGCITVVCKENGMQVKTYLKQ